jgi:hypothetical protein
MRRKDSQDVFMLLGFTVIFDGLEGTPYYFAMIPWNQAGDSGVFRTRQVFWPNRPPQREACKQAQPVGRGKDGKGRMVRFEDLGK